MQHSSDTPPLGDFVRYVERLTASNAVAAMDVRDVKLEPGQANTTQPESAVSARSVGVPAPVSTQPFAGIAVWSHLKWLLSLWIGIQLLARFVPWAGFLFLPAVLAYAVWVIFKVNRNSSGALIHRVRELVARAAQAAHAAQETRKIQPTPAKKQQ